MTGTTTATLLFDSAVNEFTDDGVFDAVVQKPNVAVVALTTNGDVFGGFYSIAVKCQHWMKPDTNVFAFFESHGRCVTPQRFDVKQWMRDRDTASTNMRSSLLGIVMFTAFPEGWFGLGDDKQPIRCVHLSQAFEGLKDTTPTGTDSDPMANRCACLIAVQLSLCHR